MQNDDFETEEATAELVLSAVDIERHALAAASAELQRERNARRMEHA